MRAGAGIRDERVVTVVVVILVVATVVVAKREGERLLG